MNLYLKRIFIGFTIVFTFCCNVSSFAQKQPVVAADPLIGDSIKAGKTLSVSDAIGVNSLSNIEETKRIDNIVSLYIDEFSDKVLPDSFNVEIRFRTIYMEGNSTDSTSDTLRISYHKNKPYNSKAVKFYHNYSSVLVRILNDTITGAPADSVRRFLVMENMMAIERYFITECSSIDSVHTDTSTIATEGELTVSWQSTIFIPLYELEWTYIDKAALDSNNYDVGGELSPDLIFRNNSTRVQIKGLSYKIPLLYDGEGTLFYRVRTLQYAPDHEIIPGQWSTDEDGLGSYVFTGHQRKLNWQATTSYAEDGKRKSVVQYYDGSLMGRQVVTKDNTTQTTIVAETLYDKQGRPTIQVLPAPTLSSLIAYNPLFNKRGVNTAEYDKSVYDTLINADEYCAAGADSMSSTTGAGLYYSPLNPLLSEPNPGFHQYIPNAKGYAFAETRYTRDNTGRIDRQGGVADSFRIGSGHETKYYYSSPEQRDIDALFGTEAGDASHYEKNMVRDANGQYSVSYVDMHGRTVATALAGGAPGSLQQLSSYISTTQTDSLLSSTNNIIKDNSIISSKSILVPTNGTYRFKYALSPESVALEDCKDSTICYDCVYDLTITISDNCSNEQFGGSPRVISLSNFSLFKADSITYNLDTTCMVADSITIDTSIYLEEGSYEITKVLSVSKPAMEYYRDSIYIPHNTCKSYQQLVLEQLDSLRQRIDCTPDSTVTNLVTAYREQMMMDLTPLVGQYADSASAFGPNPPDSICWSIFFIKPGTAKYFYQTVNGYLDEDGNLDGINPQYLTPGEFILNFKESWAATLLQLHPEYLLLVEYEKLKSAYNWESDFLSTETFEEAVAKGYLNPTGSITSPASLFTVSGAVDSLFIALAIESSSIADEAKESIEDSLFKYLQRDPVGAPSEYYTLWGLATGIVKCNNNSGDCFNHWNQSANVFNTDSLCEGDLNQAWKIFRSQYLQIREDWVDQYTRSKTGIYANQITAPCAPVFPERNFILIADAQQQYNGYDGTVNDTLTAQNNLDSFLLDNCRSYAKKWWSDLAPCGYTSTDSITIINRLIQVAYEGADRDHPFGSSTVKPSSTYFYRSFYDVIKKYNDSLYPGKDPLICNGYLIPFPRPYEQPGIIANRPLITVPDSCSCAKINELYINYETQQSTYLSFSDYMLRAQGTTISNSLLDSLRDLCNSPGNCTYLESPILLPPALQCGIGNICVDCIQVNAANDSFAVIFPGAVPAYADTNLVQRHINRIYTNFMNHQLGFAKQHGDYLAFLATCEADTLVSNDCDTTGWTVYHPGFNFHINDDLYIDAYNNVNSDSLFFSGGLFHSPSGVYVSHYVLVNKKDSLTITHDKDVLMQWRVRTPGPEVNPFALVGGNTYFGAQWVRDPADTSWWIGYTLLDKVALKVIKGIGLQAGSQILKADWVKITKMDSTTVLYFEDFLFTQGNCGGPFLCGKQAMDSAIILDMSECTDSLFYAAQGANYFFDVYREKLKGEFEKAYSSKCLDAGRLESFTVTHPLSEYHYTLYYYDQTDNLVKTVPPEGVHSIRRDTWLDSVKTYRNTGQILRPAHTLATTYRYNSLNQVISQHSPDGGLSKFWYDRLGRLVVGQNAKQLVEENYTYTLYDLLGRVTEVGQKKQTTSMTDVIAKNSQSLATWLGYTYTLDASTVIAEQVTKTVYDVRDPETSVLPSYGYVVNPSFQKAYTLRNRVSHTRFYENLDWNVDTPSYSDYDNSSIYSYDIHGNVDTLLHHYRTGMMADDHGYNEFKTMTYSYDLISGKANEVHYQPGMNDQIYHRYEYDANSRLTDVYITDRKQLIGIPVLEEHEARYSYYKHGTLARMVLGQQLVQGVDYAYTLQGWLKGVNSDSLLDEDGKPENIVGKDAYRFSLNFFNGDYYTIGQSVTSAFSGHSAYMGSDHKPLYNGNVSSMIVGIPKLGETRLNNYAYDQLHRIVNMDNWKGYNPVSLSWEDMSKTDEYKERIGYDGNGNLLKYLRNGNVGKPDMDSLTYQYNRDGNGHLTNNRLRHVDDTVSTGNYTEDIDDQDPDNYDYDTIGQLMKDEKEGIDDIKWTVYGKIKKITKSDGTVINYSYNVAGNRTSKIVTKDGNTKTTWYTRDILGNPMAIYTSVNGTLKLEEHQLYGSSRLGIWNRDIDMDVLVNTDNYIFTRGKKFFELNNHLDNVLVTISDKKSGHDASNGTYDYYDADIVSATDYAPFGMTLIGRKFRANSTYRYGFNGKENDNEVKGEGDQQDYGMRIYDPRLGRFLSVDPITAQYPELTPYQFASNSPIAGVDQDGLEFENVLIKIGYKISSFIDQSADKVRRKQAQNSNYKLTTSDHIILASNGISKATPIGTAYQLDKQIQEIRNLSSEKRKEVKKQILNNAVRTLVSTVADGATGKAPGQTAVSENLAPLVGKAVNGDTEAIFELGTGLFWGFSFRSSSVATRQTAIANAEVSGLRNFANAKWSQMRHSNEFSGTGQEILGIKTIDEAVTKLKNSTMEIQALPIDYIVRNNEIFILNTRSSVALTKAGIDRTKWKWVDRTGQLDYEKRLNKQLGVNNTGYTEVTNNTTKEVTKNP